MDYSARVAGFDDVDRLPFVHRFKKCREKVSKGRRSADPEDNRFGSPRIAPMNLRPAVEIEAIAHSKLEFLFAQFNAKAAAH
jgi:hypothetical protein